MPGQAFPSYFLSTVQPYCPCCLLWNIVEILKDAVNHLSQEYIIYIYMICMDDVHRISVLLVVHDGKYFNEK